MSIFDLSSSAGKKKPQKEVPVARKAAPVAPAVPISDAQAKSNMEQIRQLQAKLTAQLDAVLQKSGKSLKEVEVICRNPSNFSKEQWEMMQKRKEEVEVLITGKVKDKKKKQDAVASKDRRGKTLGARKNWLDMR